MRVRECEQPEVVQPLEEEKLMAKKRNLLVEDEC